jgi:hypothetical protein
VIFRRLIPVAALLLVGCSEADQAAPPAPIEEPRSPPAAAAETPTAAPSETPAASIAITDVEELAGEYRIAGVDGREIDLPHGITGRIDDTGIIVTSGCVKFSWVWFFEGTSLVTEQLFPRESCGRELLPEEQAIVAAFNGATHVGRTPANGVEFAGENGAVLLFGQ